MKTLFQLIMASVFLFAMGCASSGVSTLSDHGHDHPHNGDHQHIAQADAEPCCGSCGGGAADKKAEESDGAEAEKSEKNSECDGTKAAKEDKPKEAEAKPAEKGSCCGSCGG